MRKIGFLVGAFFVFMGLVGCMTTGTKEKASKAEEGILLRYKFTKGDVRAYKTKNIMKMKVAEHDMDNESEGIATTIIDSVDGGVANITKEIKSMKMNMNMGGNTISFDSTKKEDMEKAKDNPMLASMAKMLDMKITFKMSEKGEITDMDFKGGSDDKLIKSIFKSLTEGIKSETFSLPDKAITKGDKWSGSIETSMQNMGKLKMMYTCEFAGVKDLDGEKCAEIRIKYDKTEIVAGDNSPAQMQIENAEGRGALYISLDKGVIRKLETKMSYDIKMSGGEKDPITIHFDMDSDTDCVK